MANPEGMACIRTLGNGAVALSALALLLPAPVSGNDRSLSRQRQATAAAAGAHLQVTEVEYRLHLSSAVIKAGPVNLETIDRGLDPHDLRLQQHGSSTQLSAPRLTSGQHWHGVMDLKPGVYKLWCSLPEHALLGMHAVLRVVR
jgi:hypothetical protein